MTFNDVYEYFSYQGLEDGYNGVMSEDEMYEYVTNWPLPTLSCRKGTEDCYILGFLLGMEIKRDEQEEKEARQNRKKSGGRSTLSSGGCESEVDRPRVSVE